MTKLENLLEIQDLEIKSIQEVAKESSRPGRYKRYFEFEKDLIERGIAPSLSAYLLYEYQFNKRTLEGLGEELGLSWRPVKELMKKMNIPIKTCSEARMEVYPSEETRMKISKANKGRTFSEESKRKMSEAHKGANNYLYGKHRSNETRMKISASKRGLNNTCNKHLEDLDYVVKELQDIMDVYDIIDLPSEEELNKLGFSNLTFAITHFHGGFSKLKEFLGEPEELSVEVA